MTRNLIAFTILVIAFLLQDSLQECSENQTLQDRGRECGSCFHAACMPSCIEFNITKCYCKPGFLRLGLKHSDDTEEEPCIRVEDCPPCVRGGFHNCACAVRSVIQL